ncbi:hypothetical protein PbB2_02133 [Candidatus Phycosocius bacilliformis]|uniref:Uncharacterized protein n=1 Tax=Candidatus Phycosocius bacilliformis TaxID=1445552 RepID=A0A2P2EBM5_9PROT|nr:hypothetical protein [Candidatus Phycosocius bacilliformis]GBF58449.1 hypothetical protein PbB2_02133 [Candidatus Phycosocius bacilliformis]
MSDSSPDLIWYIWVFLAAFAFTFVPRDGKEFKRLRNHFRGSDAALRKALYLRDLLPSVSMYIAYLGLASALWLNGTIWSWVVGFTCLFVAAGVLSLFYAGPLLPLFAELEEADISARKHNNSGKSHQGI